MQKVMRTLPHFMRKASASPRRPGNVPQSLAGQGVPAFSQQAKELVFPVKLSNGCD